MNNQQDAVSQYFLINKLLNKDKKTVYGTYILHFDMEHNKVDVNYPLTEFEMKPNSFNGKSVKEWIIDELHQREKEDHQTQFFIKNNGCTSLVDVFLDHYTKNNIQYLSHLVAPRV